VERLDGGFGGFSDAVLRKGNRALQERSQMFCDGL